MASRRRVGVAQLAQIRPSFILSYRHRVHYSGNLSRRCCTEFRPKRPYSANLSDKVQSADSLQPKFRACVKQLSKIRFVNSAASP